MALRICGDIDLDDHCLHHHQTSSRIKKIHSTHRSHTTDACCCQSSTTAQHWTHLFSGVFNKPLHCHRINLSKSLSQRTTRLFSNSDCCLHYCNVVACIAGVACGRTTRRYKRPTTTWRNHGALGGAVVGLVVHYLRCPYVVHCNRRRHCLWHVVSRNGCLPWRALPHQRAQSCRRNHHDIGVSGGKFWPHWWRTFSRQ